MRGGVGVAMDATVAEERVSGSRDGASTDADGDGEIVGEGGGYAFHGGHCAVRR